jgi:arylsulfatase A-like enzyme
VVNPRRPSVLLLAAGVVVVGFALILRLVQQGSADPRPVGSLDDVLAFRDRTDFNVLFILVDTLRAERLSAYGYERDTSPNLAALAETGIRFATHVSQSSWTKCSMASLWTGLYPIRTGVLRHQHVLAPEARTPAEIFREAGFRTAALWRNGWIAPNFGFDQGFEIYNSPKPVPMPAAVRRENPNISIAGTDADIIRSSFEFLRAHGRERWFLYLHLMDVHQYLYTEDSALFGTSYSDIYDNSIRWVDSLIGHLIEELEKQGLRDRTLIVFASDHGEAFGEHGGEGHARNVYGEVTETPLILNFPFRLEPGLVVEARTENVDLWPTVLELVGLPPLVDPDGRSVMPEIVAAAGGESAPSENGLAFAQIDQAWGKSRRPPYPLVAVNSGRWRLIYPAPAPLRAELYDKLEDPDEQVNLAEAHPELVQELSARATEYLESPPPPWGTGAPTIELDEMQLHQLRALGYGVQ